MVVINESDWLQQQSMDRATIDSFRMAKFYNKSMKSIPLWLYCRNWDLQNDIFGFNQVFFYSKLGKHQSDVRIHVALKLANFRCTSVQRCIAIVPNYI